MEKYSTDTHNFGNSDDGHPESYAHPQNDFEDNAYDEMENNNRVDGLNDESIADAMDVDLESDTELEESYMNSDESNSASVVRDTNGANDDESDKMDGTSADGSDKSNGTSADESEKSNGTSADESANSDEISADATNDKICNETAETVFTTDQQIPPTNLLSVSSQGIYTFHTLDNE